MRGFTAVALLCSSVTVSAHVRASQQESQHVRAGGTTGPCDIYAQAGTPCVAAHSVVRALYGNYSGPLYEVERLVDGEKKHIGVLSRGGFAAAALQDAFCRRSACVVAQIFDQSPHGNHLAPPTKSGGRPYQCPATGCLPVNATKQQHTVAGNPVWGAVFEGSMGYRNDNTSGIAIGDEPETMYMVASGTYYSDGCCFDYGNAELDMKDDGTGTMEVNALLERVCRSQATVIKMDC